MKYISLFLFFMFLASATSAQQNVTGNGNVYYQSCRQLTCSNTGITIGTATGGTQGTGTINATGLYINGVAVGGGGGSGTVSPSTIGQIPVYTGSTTVAGNTGLTYSAGAVTIGTSLTTPLIIGGTGATSTLTLESTSGTGTTDAIIFKTGSQAEAARILTGGTVAIGTATVSTSNKLGVYGSETVGTGYANLAAPTNGLAVSGNVGVGTSNPSTFFEVSGASGSGDIARLTNSAGPISIFFDAFTFGNVWAAIGATDNGVRPFQIRTTALTIDSGATPAGFSSALNVSGNATIGAETVGAPTNGLYVVGGVVLGTASLVSGSGTTISGHIGYAPTNVPTVTTCGSGTLAVGSTDNKGQITGITAATACTITFSSVLPAAPACSFSSNAAIIPTVTSLSTSAVTTAMAALTGTLYYICQ